MQPRDCAFLFAALLSSAVLASEPAPRYNVVSLQASAQREVPNDLVKATLTVEVNDATAAKVGNALNRSLNDALRTAKQFPSVRASSGNSRTFPIYTRGNQLQGWRGRGELRLESEDFAALPELIGKLQGSLQLGGLQFSVSPQARRAAENALVTEAIAAFKARADIIKTALGGRGYKLQSLDVSSGQRPPPVPRVAMAQSVSAAPAVAPPELEAGLSTITVSASGTIEILE
ncbi:MAG TPA: SIMPL domain-containing protein [Burkholderiales bacterium]|nr:SIMPL domain-containing protein [Burkholderiales bacterium]